MCIIVRLVLISLVTAPAVQVNATPLRDMPVRVYIKIVPSVYDGAITKTGNVVVVFSGDREETWTHDGDCHSALLSTRGDVGWVHIDKKHIISPKMLPQSEDMLVLRRLDGTVEQLLPFQRPPQEDRFIQAWRFADDGAAVILRSMGYHGPSSFLKYSVDSGKEEEACQGYVPFQRLPGWAKPLGDPAEN